VLENFIPFNQLCTVMSRVDFWHVRRSDDRVADNLSDCRSVDPRLSRDYRTLSGWPWWNVQEEFLCRLRFELFSWFIILIKSILEILVMVVGSASLFWSMVVVDHKLIRYESFVFCILDHAVLSSYHSSTINSTLFFALMIFL
jgi:hypothetical protein